MEEDGSPDTKAPLKEEFSMGGDEEDKDDEIEGEKFSDSEDDD
jgi:hypothetical protein